MKVLTDIFAAIGIVLTIKTGCNVLCDIINFIKQKLK